MKFSKRRPSGESPEFPAERENETAARSDAATRWIFVVSPPRERPIPCLPLFLKHRHHRDVPWRSYCPDIWLPRESRWCFPVGAPQKGTAERRSYSSDSCGHKRYANFRRISAMPSICSRFPWHTNRIHQLEIAHAYIAALPRQVFCYFFVLRLI